MLPIIVTNNLFEENKLLKLDDIIKIEQLKLVFLFKNGDLPKELNNLCELNVNTYNTRNASKGGLKIPKMNTTSFGNRSLRYSGSTPWNNCIKPIKDFIDIKSKSQLKSYEKNCISIVIKCNKSLLNILGLTLNCHSSFCFALVFLTKLHVLPLLLLICVICFLLVLVLVLMLVLVLVLMLV